MNSSLTFMLLFILVTAAVVSVSMFLKPRRRPVAVKQDHSAPSNELEAKLLLASASPPLLNEVPGLLMKTKMLVLGTISEDRKIGLKHWEVAGRTVIPAFTSLERLRESISRQEHYVEMDAGTFLKSIPGNSDVVLNPNSKFTFEIKSAQIGKILEF